VFYWREQNREVDFIIRAGRTVLALKVKSGRSPDAFPGLDEFSKAFEPTRTLLIGGADIALVPIPRAAGRALANVTFVAVN
jgi:hypothetical protein